MSYVMTVICYDLISVLNIYIILLVYVILEDNFKCVKY